jgi:hypothetical protein
MDNTIFLEWNDTSSWTDNDVVYRFPKQQKRCYRNGERLGKGNYRPDPFWLKLNSIICAPLYHYIIQRRIFHLLLRGAYSRKFDKVRRKRKKRLF